MTGGFVIYDPVADRYLKERPTFGRFLLWTGEPDGAFVYPSHEDAEAEARFTWLKDWTELVQILAVDREPSR